MSGPRLFDRVIPYEIGNFREHGSRSPFRNQRLDEIDVSDARTPLPFSPTDHVSRHGLPPRGHPPGDTSPSTQRPNSRHQHHEFDTAASQSQTTMSSADRNDSREDFSRATRRSSHTSHSSLDLSTATSIEGKEFVRARPQSGEISRWRWQDSDDWHDSDRNSRYGSDDYADEDDDHEEEDDDEDGTTRSDRQFPPLLPTVDRRPRMSKSARNRVTPGQLAEQFAKRRGQWASAAPLSDTGTTHTRSHSVDDDQLAVSWNRYRAQRVKMQNIRKDMAELRPRIRNNGRLRDQSDNDFMGLVRYYATATGGETTLIPVDVMARHFRKMQVRRTEFHEAETAYEQLEADLEREESFFEIVETQFFTLLYQETQQYAAEDDDRSAPSPPMSLRGISGDRETAGDSPYTDLDNLVNAIGDRDLARETLSDLEHERDRILYLLDQRLKIERVKGMEGNPSRDIRPSEQFSAMLKTIIPNLSIDALRRRFGRYMKQVDLEFLRDFENDAAKARDQLADATGEVIRLKKLCLEKGLISSKDEMTLRGVPDLLDCPQLVDGLGHPQLHALMSNPKHLLDEEPQIAEVAFQTARELPPEDPNREGVMRSLGKEVGINAILRNFIPENKSDYINRWLLHRVVTTPLEAMMLYNVFSTRWQVRDLLRWQHDVQFHWARDKANIPAEDLKGPLTSLDSLDWQVYEENTARVNWDAIGPSRAGSDGFEVHVRRSQVDRLDSLSEP